MTGSDFGAFGAFYGLLLLCAIVLAPLGLWKLVEIIIWLCHHVHLSLS